MGRGRASRLVWGMLALLAGAFALALWTRRSDETPDAPPAARTEPTPPASPSLATGPGDASSEPSEVDGRTPGGPAPLRYDGPSVPTGRKRVRFALRLAPPGVGASALRISAVGGHHRAGEPLPAQEVTIETSAGDTVAVATDDPRAALQWISHHVPSPAPDTITITMPARHGPPFSSFALEVVDVATKAPLPFAELVWHPSTRMPSRVPADPAGRIPLAPLDAPLAPLEALQAVLDGHAALRATGYRSRFGFADAPFGDRRTPSPPISTDEVRALYGRGMKWPVAMHRLPEERSERTLRLVDAKEAPVVGALLVLSDVLSDPEARDTFLALGSAITPEDVGRTFVRTGPDGTASLSAWSGGAVGVEMSVDGVPFAAWAFTERGSAKERAVTLRVPEQADVEIVVEGAPPDSVRFSLHPVRGLLGSAVTPLDLAQSPIPMGLPVDGLDPALAILLPGSAAMGWEGVARGDPPTLRLPVAVGRGITLYVGARRLEVKPTEPGPMRIAVRLEDLPKVDLGPDFATAKDD